MGSAIAGTILVLVGLTVVCLVLFSLVQFARGFTN